MDVVVGFVRLAIEVFSALVGFPVLLSLLITAAEYFGLDEEVAGVVSFWTNVAVFVGVLVASILGKIDLVSGLDVVFGNLSQIISAVLVLLGIPVGFLMTNSWRVKMRTTKFVANRLYGFDKEDW